MIMILSLGGNKNRINTTIAHSKSLTAKGIKHFVVLTGLGETQESLKILKESLKETEVILDVEAIDTVGNFTTTYKYVTQRKVKSIFVVTDDWHMRRSMAIAQAIYTGTPIQVKGVNHVESKRVDKGNTWADVIRAISWRVMCRGV